MNRFCYKQLLDWKKSKCGNLLVLGGVPGVGKTRLSIDFAEREFRTYLYVDVKKDRVSDKLNQMSFEEENNLVIIDNVMGNRKLLNEIYLLSCEYKSLYFIFIDSFIKDGYGEKLSIPLSYIILYPMTFEEFLYNCDLELYKELQSVGHIKNIDRRLNEKLLRVFSHFLFIGGMPEVVNIYVQSGLNSDLIRNEQLKIMENLLENLKCYYKTTDYKNLKSIIDVLTENFNRDNKKFKLSDISRSKRFISFRKYFDKLESLNITHKSNCIKGDDINIDEKSFILYFFDIGLLGLLGDVPVELYSTNNLMSNPVSLTLCQNFIANELVSSHVSCLYNWNHNMSKVEFILTAGDEFIPVEVKNDVSGKLKSLESFNHFYSYKRNLRLNSSVYTKKGKVETFPIYIVNILYRSLIS